MAAIFNERSQYVDANGKPLLGGKVFIGKVGLEPIDNPEAIFANPALSIPLDNPQDIDALGRTVNQIYVAGQYSIRVEDKDEGQNLLSLVVGVEPESGGVISLIDVQGFNAITAKASPPITAYVDKQEYLLTAEANNTLPMTLNINNVGIRSIEDSNIGLVKAGQIMSLIFNGFTDVFQLGNIKADGKPGSSIDWWGPTAPIGWVFEDGAAYDSIANPAFARLFSIIGITLGGSGASNFNVPDSRGRATIGLDNLGGTPADRMTNAQADILGGSGGSETHTLILGEIPSHTHNGPDHTHTISTLQANPGSSPGSGAGAAQSTPSTNSAGTGATSSSGSGDPHANDQPWIATRKIIKL